MCKTSGEMLMSDMVIIVLIVFDILGEGKLLPPAAH